MGPDDFVFEVVYDTGIRPSVQSHVVMHVAVEHVRRGGNSYQPAQFYKYSGYPNPQNPLSVTIDAAGNLYGNSQQGGHNSCSYGGCGTIFRLSPNSNGGYISTVLHEFSGSDGLRPVGNLILDAAG